MTYLQKICYFYELTPQELKRRVVNVFGNTVSDNQIKRLFSENHTKNVLLSTLIKAATVLDANPNDVIFGTQEYSGYNVDFD